MDLDDLANLTPIERLAGYEAELKLNESERLRQSERKSYAVLLLVVGAAIFVGNLTGATGPANGTLGTLAVIALIIGGVWLSDISKSVNELGTRSITLQPAAKSIKDRLSNGVPPGSAPQPPTSPQ